MAEENKVDGSRASEGYRTIAAELRRLADQIEPSPQCFTCGDQPIGTSHWGGTYKGCPAVTLSYFGGACLYVFRDGRWTNHERFNSLHECHKKLGIDR